MQVRQVRPRLVAVRDGSKVEQLKELLHGAPVQPEIAVGDQGAVEVAVHPDAEAVITGPLIEPLQTKSCLLAVHAYTSALLRLSHYLHVHASGRANMHTFPCCKL